MIRPEDAQSARQGIADTLASIDAGELEATDVQRAFLAGAVATLDALTDQVKKSSD
jgi:hypothetical protein